jgi:hypothetical protein
MKFLSNFSIIPLEDYLIEPRKWDLFIACGSFEKRSVPSTEIFQKNTTIDTSIIVNYTQTNPEKQNNMKIMKSNLELICNDIHIFDVGSVLLPSEGIKEFRKLIVEKNIDLANKKIIVDVSAFPKPYLFLLVKILFNLYNNSQMHFIYTEPEKYKNREIQSTQVSLTAGLDRIESIPGFTGSSTKSKDALIVILGFEGNRSIEVFRNIDPAVTYAINGFPSLRPGWHKISLDANMSFLEESGSLQYLYYSPAIDPFETKKLISKLVAEIKEEDEDFNILIAPLGTKMQAFGVLLYALKDNTIKVVYPFPSRYNEDRSKGWGQTWILNAEFLEND